MTIDAQGIYQYDGAELGAPGHQFMNLGMASVSATASDIRADIAALELLQDSDWMAITSIGTGWVAAGAWPVRVRKLGNKVDLSGMLTASTATPNTEVILTIPTAFRPPGYFWLGYTHSQQGFGAMMSIQASGVVTLNTEYGEGALSSGMNLPLLGTWYVN